MKKLLFLAVILALVIPMVVAAKEEAPDKDRDYDYAQTVRSNFMDKIDNQKLTMIFDDIKILKGSEPYTFPLTVGRGDYEIWALGGRGVKKLNVEIYAASGDRQAESSVNSDAPVLTFSEAHSKSHKVEVEATEFDTGVTEGYFVIVVVRK